MLAGWLADCLAGSENWVLGEGVSVVAWGASAGPFPSPSFPGTQQKNTLCKSCSQISTSLLSTIGGCTFYEFIV